MRKTFFLFTVLAAIFVNGQTEHSQKLFEKITAGVVFSTLASTSFSGSEKPFLLEYNLSPNITFDTKKTFHEFLYGFSNNSLSTLNGYFLKKDYDIYILYSNILDTHSNYIGCGLEKMIQIENIEASLLAEIGTDFEGNKILSFGLLLKIQI